MLEKIKLQKINVETPVNKKNWTWILNIFVSIVLFVATAWAANYKGYREICPKGFHSVLAFRGQCYFIADGYYEHSFAKSYCKDKGGYLLEPYNGSSKKKCIVI